MKRAILFRFHKNHLVCKNHLQLLRNFNPNTLIYGLYGGDSDHLPKMKKYLRKNLKHFFSITHYDNDWKWKNSDLAVRFWFKKYGHKMQFDLLHVVEWDLIIFDKLSTVYQHIPQLSLGLTGLRPLKGVEHRWLWTAKHPWRSKWLRFKRTLSKQHNFPDPINVCLGPGPVFPRSFLEAFARYPRPSQLVHDEIRLPIYAQMLGYDLTDTKFYMRWFDDIEKRQFNCVNREIDDKVIENELLKPNGRRVFHPYRKAVPASWMNHTLVVD